MLLLKWSLEAVEEEAWIFALDGWQQTPPIVVDYDRVYAGFLDVQAQNETHLPVAQLSQLSLLLSELRERAQLVQTRAASIRLSASEDRILAVAIERVLPDLQRMAEGGGSTRLAESVKSSAKARFGELAKSMAEGILSNAAYDVLKKILFNELG